ncbi:MAG: hypothetical protein ACKVPY_04875 [Paracoccaceae bacterium]
MELIADILLGAGALGAAAYCLVLSRRLRRFSTLENGMGGAIAILSKQVDDMTHALEKAQATSGEAAARLDRLTGRGEAASQRLELILAALHDLPETDATGHAGRPRVIRRRRDAASEAAE